MAATLSPIAPDPVSSLPDATLADPQDPRANTAPSPERMPSPPGDSKSWKASLAPFTRADTRVASWQFASSFFLWVANAAAILWSLDRSLWLAAALSCLQGGLFIRIFVLHHDCGHGSFFPSKRWNDRVGSLLGLLSLTPYRYWRRTHSIHHATSGNLDRREFGDIATLTVEEYLALPWWRRAGYRLYRNPAVLVVVGPLFQFFVKHRVPYDAPLAWRAEWIGVIGQNLLLAGAFWGLWTTFGWQSIFFLFVQPIIIGGGLGLWLFYVQHQFEDTYWRRADAWNFEHAGLLGSSYLDMPAWLHWFTANIGYHHVHHLASRIPNYRLRDCVESIPEFREINRFTLLESLQYGRLNLWDEARQCLISFRDLQATRA